ncbi:MAG: deoxyribose-phosphate aldolase [Treponema sp. GWB1_62_6]|nr:MAG: deoxyribose-phosphate aldolase [Treponema sp. GWC1_61_84]OHE71775.1 MAG: deoxyribose-phosphate aldolase [Treponema sp. GWB1_62_6]
MEDERPAAKISPEDIAKYIDHTMLRPEAATAAFDQLCEEALRYGFYGVCVNSGRVAYVARRLKGTAVKVCSVVGFPLGAMTSAAKAFEAGEAIRCGASEIDMVINVGLLKSGDLAGVEADIRAVREATKADTVLKVIIETALLSDVEKVMACELSKKAGANFVKTCTGFAGGGATAEDLALMRRVVGPGMGVKASGGVRSYKAARAFLDAGADRLGAVSSVAIVTEIDGGTGY